MSFPCVIDAAYFGLLLLSAGAGSVIVWLFWLVAPQCRGWLRYCMAILAIRLMVKGLAVLAFLNMADRKS